MLRTTSSSIEHGPSRWAASTFVVGGILMIIMYALQIVHGLRTSGNDTGKFKELC